VFSFEARHDADLTTFDPHSIHIRGTIHVMRRLSVVSTLFRLLGRAALAWARHGGSSMGAAIAFYTLISLPSAVAVMLKIASFAFNLDTARETLLSQIQMLWGPEAAATTASIAHYAMQSRAETWGIWVAVATGFVTASTVFVEMRRSLDMIWGKDEAGTGAGAVKSRLTSFAALVVLGAALWISVLTSAFLESADVRYPEHAGLSAMTLSMIGNGVAGILILALLTALYKLLPEQHVAWSEAWSGAAVVTCLYFIGKEILAAYLGGKTIAPAFGGGIAGALIVLLMWFYYSAQIFLFGAELSHEMALEKISREPRG